MIERNPLLSPDELSVVSRPSGKGQPHVLIVDNDLELLDLLAEFLSKEGYTVLTCAKAEEALDILADKKVDLVISSTEIEDKDGFEFLEKVKSDSKLKKIPFFFLSALDEPSERLKALRAGADDYLIKPFNPQELLIRIERSLKATQDELSQKDLVGKIKENSVPEILQYFANSHMTGHLTLISDGQKGELWFRDGELVKAICGDKKNEEAVYQVMTFRDGKFYFVENECDLEREIETSLLAIILEGLRILDEKKAGVFPGHNAGDHENAGDSGGLDLGIKEIELQILDEGSYGEGEETGVEKGDIEMSKADELLSEIYAMGEVKDGMVITHEGAVLTHDLSPQMKKWVDLLKYFSMASLQVKSIIGFPRPWYVQIDDTEGRKILIVITEKVFVILLFDSMSVPSQHYQQIVKII